MNHLSRSQRRQLLRMMFSGEEPMMSTFAKKDRAPLVERDLVTLHKRGRATHMVLTDQAWSQADALIAAELDAGGTPDLAHHLLARTRAYLQAEEVALVDFVQAPGPPAPSYAEAQVHDAYLRLTHGAYRREVRITDLRTEARSIASAELEHALMGLVRKGAAHLMPIDDPLERTPRDDDAAMQVAGQPRHIVFLEAQ